MTLPTDRYITCSGKIFDVFIDYYNVRDKENFPESSVSL